MSRGLTFQFKDVQNTMNKIKKYEKQLNFQLKDNINR